MFNVALLIDLHSRELLVDLQLEQLHIVVAVVARAFRVAGIIVHPVFVVSSDDDLRLPGDGAGLVGLELAPEDVADGHANLRLWNGIECLAIIFGHVKLDRRMIAGLGPSFNDPAFPDRDQVVAAALGDGDDRERRRWSGSFSLGRRQRVGEPAGRRDELKPVAGTWRASRNRVKQQIPVGGEHRVAGLFFLRHSHGCQSL